MTSARFTRALREFDALCDTDSSTRQRALAALHDEDPELAREVEELLAADTAASALDVSAAASFLDLTGSELETSPTRIGEFEVLRVLGDGGMGIVYEAQQSVPRRKVALKLIRPGLLSDARLRRFHQEAEVLASLDHPGIAKIYSAGTARTAAGPQPYIAMELVQGMALDSFAAAHQLDVRARLGLVAELCDAVQHAHQRGVVHRDLKPANVLVGDDGRPKVLDFGVARMTDGDLARLTAATAVGEVLGTLPYMSPEQIAADPELVDVRTDVYALGVLAYELLAGRLPLDVQRKSLAEAARIIAEEEPPTLGSIDESLRGEVEWIVTKALAKDRDERYLTAEALARDLRRHLADEPILARPPSRIEQWRKFARRERGLVTGLAAAFFALLVGVVVTSVLLARTSRLLAERNEEVLAAEEAITFLEGLFAQADPMQDKDLRLSEMALAAARRFDDALLHRPVLRARLLNSIGKVLNDLALPAQAMPLLEEARVLRLQEHGAGSVELAQTLERLAYSEAQLGHLQRAIELQREVLATRRARLPDSELLADALSNLAGTLSMVGEADEADALSREAVEVMTRVNGQESRQVLWASVTRVGVLMAIGRYPESEALARELLEKHDEHGATDARISLRRNLGWSLRQQERYAEAEPVAREAIALALERYGEESSLQRDLYSLLGSIVTGLGRPAEAVELLRELHTRVVAREGPGSILTAHVTHDLAYMVHDLPPPQRDEAEGLYREASRGFAARLGEENALSAMALNNLSVLLNSMGRHEEAEQCARRSYDMRSRLLGEADPNTLASLRGLAETFELGGQDAEAEAAFARYLARAAPLFGDGDARVQRARIMCARVLEKLERFDDARVLLDEVERCLPVTYNREVIERSLAERRAKLQARAADSRGARQ